jgi:hypothetical protein
LAIAASAVPIKSEHTMKKIIDLCLSSMHDSRNSTAKLRNNTKKATPAN